jgi:hypothetical protein
MKLLRCCFYFSAFVLITILALRLASTASRTEIGWETLASQWQDASVGWLGVGQKPISSEIPSKQADFFLSETDRVVSKASQEADAVMGGGWILDSPSIGFYHRHIKQTEFASILPQFGSTLDYDAIHREEDEFERRWKNRCWELAARATELAPHDVRWWRMRALLQFRVHSGGADWEPRRDSWLPVLDKCANNDPDNALYDYLAALQLWQRGGSYEWEEEGYKVVVADDGLFSEGTRRLSSAQHKRFLSFGESGFPAVTEFLSRCRLSSTDQAEVAVNRITSLRDSTLFYRLWRWLEAQADMEKRKGDVQAEIALRHQALRFADQFESTNETAALESTLKFHVLQIDAIERIRLSSNLASSGGSNENAQLAQREVRVRTDQRVLFHALQDWANERGDSNVHAPSICVAVALVTTSTLLEIGIALFAVSLLLPPTTEVGLGITRHLAAWTVGFGMTFVILGVAPAELISRSTQSRIAYSLVCVVMLSIAAFIGWQLYGFMRRRKFQFSLLNLMTVMLASSMIFSLWPILRGVGGVLDGHPSELWLPARGWDKLDAEVLRFALQVPKASWQWAFVQWAVGFGPFIGIGASLVILVIWQSFRSTRRESTRILQYWTSDLKRHGGNLLRCVSKSALVVGLTFLVVYLWFAPDVIENLQAQHAYKMTFYRDPDGHWESIQRAVERVKADSVRMEEIKKKVASETAQRESAKAAELEFEPDDGR